MFIFIVLFISCYYFFEILKFFSCSGMFRDVLECSGMFRKVPCSGFYRRPRNNISGWHRIFWPNRSSTTRSHSCQHHMKITQSHTFEALIRLSTTTHTLLTFNISEISSNTVNSLIATTSRKRPPPVSDHFTNNPFVSQSNTVSKTLS